MKLNHLTWCGGRTALISLHEGSWLFTQNRRLPGHGVVDEISQEFVLIPSRQDLDYDRSSFEMGRTRDADSNNRVTFDGQGGQPTLYYEFNFPDLFAAYNGYYVAINVNVDSHSNPPFWREQGWQMEFDVRQLLESASISSPYIRMFTEGGVLRAFLMGKLSGLKLRVTVRTSVDTSLLREGSYAVLNFLVNSVLYGQRLQIGPPPAGLEGDASDASSDGAWSSSEWDILLDDV